MTKSLKFSRRALLAGLPLLAAGCGMVPDGDFSPGGYGNYGGIEDDGNPIPPLDLTSIDRDLVRQQVAWRGTQRPGSIVVNIPERRLYLILAGGRALRYAVGVGR